MKLSCSVPLLAIALISSSSTAKASEPRLRVSVVEEDVETVAAMKFHPKMEFSIDKSFQCRGATDPSKGGAGKKCEANMKKKAAIGLGPIEIASDMATDMQGLFQELMPNQDSFMPMDDDLMKMMTIENDMTVDADEMEDGASKTMKIGGFFKANWDCTVTWKKEATLKVSKTVECEAKAVQGTGPAPEELEDEADDEF